MMKEKRDGVEARLITMETNMNELEKVLSELSVLQEQQFRKYEEENDAWWNSLTQQEREDAFYAVIKRMYQAEVTDRRSYRGSLYDVFGFDGGMYSRGMDCGYMSLHNMIFDALEYESMCNVTRFEVIDEKGRTYVNYLNEDQRVKFSLQDDDRTLKVFIDNHSWKEGL